MPRPQKAGRPSHAGDDAAPAPDETGLIRRLLAHKASATAQDAMRTRAADATAAELLKLQMVFQHAEEGILLVDDHGRYTDVNPEACRITGYTQEELKRMHVWEMGPPIRASVGLERFRGFIARGKQEGEYMLLRKDGSTIPVEYRAVAEILPGVHLSVLRDISRRHKAEEELRRSEDRYRAFIDQSSEGIWRFELEEPLSPALPEDEQIDAFYRLAVLAECNDALARMYGFDKAAQIEGARLGDMLPRDNPANIAYLRAFIRSGYNLSGGESHEVDKDGNPKCFLNTLTGIMENGMLVRAWGLQQDITATCAAQEQQRLSEERLRLALDAGNMGVWEWDIISGKILWSDRVAEFYNMKPGEFDGSYAMFARHLYPEDAARVQAAITASVEQNAPFLIEHRIIRTDGQVRWIHTSGKVIRDAAGTPLKMIGATADVTEHRHGEEELRQSEERLRLALDAGRMGVWDWDLRTGRIQWTDRVAELHGITADAFSGTVEEFTRLVHPDDCQRVDMAIQNALRQDEPYYIEFRVVHPHSGGVHWLETSGRVYRDAQGNPVRMLGATADITERRQAEESIRHSEARYRAIVQANPECVKLVSPEGMLLEMNTAGLRMIEGDRQVIGSCVYDIVVPEHREAFRRFNERVCGGEPGSLEFDIIGLKGTRRSMETHAVPLTESDGRTVQLAVTRDVTARRHAEESIRRLNAELEWKVEERTRQLREALQSDRANLERLRFMMDRLPLAAIVIDENDVVLQANLPFCEALCGHADPSRLLGKPIGEVTHAFSSRIVDGEAHARQTAELFRARRQELGTEMRMIDGRMLVRDYIPVFDAGEFRGHLYLYRDVTQERRIDATKSEFMSLASHQLRTPLTSIRWTFSRLSRSLGDRANAADRRLIKEGKASAMRMSETIDTMLAISRIESGKLQPLRSAIDLCTLLRGIVDLHQEDAKRKQMHVTVDCTADLPVTSDPHFLKEIVGNLIENAIKYTPDGGSVAVRAAVREGMVRVEVEDTGLGIPRHQQEYIFRKFFRGENVVSAVTEGSGLGLYLVSLMAGLLGGTITFVSEEGKGSTFTLLVPAGGKQA